MSPVVWRVVQIVTPIRRLTRRCSERRPGLITSLFMIPVRDLNLYSLRDMKPFVRLTVIWLVLFALSSCDVGRFGFGTKQVAAGYRLVQHEGLNPFALKRPQQGYTSAVSEIGWRQPLILARSDAFHPWDVIDTSTKRQISITDRQRRSDPSYRDIPVHTAAEAWHKLSRMRGQW